MIIEFSLNHMLFVLGVAQSRIFLFILYII